VKSSLPPNVYSPDHVRFCIEELQAYATSLHKRERGARSVEELLLSPESTSLLQTLAADQQNQPLAITELTEQLAEFAEKAPTFGLTLSAPASHHLKEELVAWMRQNIEPRTLVEFHVNPDIAGGMLLRSTNKVYDCSFRQLLLDKSERFTRILENV
jgi:F0F1-type ATP synthase delta subunit